MRAAGSPAGVRIPAGIDDLDSFRRWAKSDDFPQHGRFAYLRGQIWVDLSMEQAFWHNQVKAVIAVVLFRIVRSGGLGYFFTDGMLLSNLDADFTTAPDGIFVSFDTIEAIRLQLVEGAEDGCVELVGAPDMVLEVVSDSSVGKDTEEMRELYWRAGIPEYWLVDARGEALQFQILRRTARGYSAVRPQRGWLRSPVFSRAFRLTRKTDRLGNPSYNLLVRE